MANTTTDHDVIREWVEEREGVPSMVKGTEGLLRIDYPGFNGEDSLQKLSWEEFFQIFDENHLAFLYEDEEDSRFSKFIEGD